MQFLGSARKRYRVDCKRRGAIAQPAQKLLTEKIGGKVLHRHGCFAATPAVADCIHHWSDNVEHDMFKCVIRERVAEDCGCLGAIVGLQGVEQTSTYGRQKRMRRFSDGNWLVKRRRRRRGSMGMLEGVNSVADAHSLVQAQLHPLEMEDLILRIEAMTPRSAASLWEVVAAFPDTECRLRNASHARHSANAEHGPFFGRHHWLRTIHFACLYLTHSSTHSVQGKCRIVHVFTKISRQIDFFAVLYPLTLDKGRGHITAFRSIRGKAR